MASKWGTQVANTTAQHTQNNQHTKHRRIAKQLLAGTAMSLGALMLFAPITAQANTGTAKTEIAQANTSFDFDIAAQNLNNALLAFAQQTGIQIFYDTAQVENLTSQAVTGTMTAAEALAKLLEGSDVKFSFTDDASVTLVAGGDGTLMDPVVVEAQGASNPGDPAATEGTGSFTTTVAGVGSKGNETIRELPQSVSVVTAERIEQQNFQYLDDAMRYTTGVQVLQNNAGRSSLFSRGYEVTDALTNGVSVPYSSLDGTSPNLAMYDRIEVLRGPAGLYGGSGEPTSTINLVRKQAADHLTGSASLGYGSWNHYSGQGDISVPLVEDGSVRARAVVSTDYRDSFVKTVENNNELGYATLDADISDDTFVSFGVSHEHKDMVPFNGLPTDSDGNLLDVSVSTFTGADWNTFENTSDDLYFDLKHSFSNQTDANVSLRYSLRNINMNYAYTNQAASGGSARYGALVRNVDEEAFAADTYVNHRFDLLGYEQELTIGADALYTDQYVFQKRNNNIGTFSISSPSIGYVTSYTDLLHDYEHDTSQFGAYSKLKLQTFDNVTFSVGGRTSWYNSVQKGTVTRTANTVNNMTEDAVFTPFAGVVVDVTDDLSTYFSYTSIFEPQSDVDSSGSQIDPRTGEQFEIGLKGEHFGGLLNTHLAAFQIDDENRVATDPDDSTAKIAAGKQRTRGIEAEISGEVIDNLQAFAGYTYLYTTDQSTDDSDEVSTSYSPRHYVTSWLDYSFDQGAVDGLSVGGGVTWSDSTRINDPVETPSYYVVDGRIGYEINESLEVALNANNLLNEKYYTRAGGTATFNFYGAPRNFFLSVTGKF